MMERSDRNILIGIGVITALVLVLALFATSGSGAYGYPSSHGTDSEGAKAAYLLLQQLGYNAQRTRQDPTLLGQRDASRTLLVLAMPTRFASSEESSALRRFVDNGGTVLAIGPSAAWILKLDDDIVPILPHYDYRNYQWQVPSSITRAAPEISMTPRVDWKRGTAAETQYADADNISVVSLAMGSGKVIWWAAADPLTNAGIQKSNNLQFFLNCVGSPGAHDILWDEYFHEGPEFGRGKGIGALKWISLQLLLVGAIIVFTYSRRHGPLRPLPETPRTSPLEFVETLGNLYRRSGAYDIAVTIAYQHYRQQIQRRFGITTRLSAAELAERIAQQKGADPDYVRTLQVCEAVAAKRRTVSRAEAGKIVEKLYALNNELQFVSKGSQNASSHANRAD